MWVRTLSFKFGKQSAANLLTCDNRLQALFNSVILYRDCSILCGHRNEHEQMLAYPKYSNAMWPDSRHNTLPSLAVDVVPYPVDWDDKNSFHEFAGFVLGMAACMDINIKWGGHFNWTFDGPHFEVYK